MEAWIPKDRKGTRLCTFLGYFRHDNPRFLVLPYVKSPHVAKERGSRVTRSNNSAGDFQPKHGLSRFRGTWIGNFRGSAR